MNLGACARGHSGRPVLRGGVYDDDLVDKRIKAPQPLAGEVAARRSLFERIPFATGYAVETAMLLHARDTLGGTGAMAQVDLDVRVNRHQPLLDLGPMAYAVLRVVLERLRAEGRLLDDHAPPFQTADGGLVQVEVVERPPYATLRARA